MRKQDFIPSGDGMFDLFQRVLIDYVSGKIEDWGIAQAILSALLSIKILWDGAWEEFSRPSERTPKVIADKNTARALYEPALRQFIKSHIANNELVTAGDKAAMGLPIYSHTRTPAPEAVTWPIGHSSISAPNRVEIHFKDSGIPEGSKSAAKPYGMHGAEIRWAVLEAAPTSYDQLVNSSFDTATPFILSFPLEQHGKTVYFALRWENTRGIKGPFSPIYNANIP